MKFASLFQEVTWFTLLGYRAVLKSSSKVTLLMKELLKRSIILVLIIIQNIPPLPFLWFLMVTL